MIPGAATATVAADRAWPPMGWELWWLPRSRLSSGEAMPDRAALIEAQIPGLRRFACALLRGDREGADDLVQDTLERALSHWHLRRSQGNLRGWLYTILYNRFLSDQHRVRRRGPHDALTEQTELPGIDGGQHSVLEHRDLLRLCDIVGGAAGGASVGRRRGPLLPGGGACTGSAHRHGDVEAFAWARAFAALYPRRPRRK
jgi:Sigma-70 region 2